MKQHGLARLVGMADDLTTIQLTGLAKIADHYGKSEVAEQFNAQLRLRKLSNRKTRAT